MDDRLVTGEPTLDDGLGIAKWPESLKGAQLDDVRDYLVKQREHGRSEVASRRVELLREYYHFLQFGKNGDDYQLLPNEVADERKPGVDAFLAEHGLNATEHMLVSNADDLVFSYAVCPSAPAPSEEVATPYCDNLPANEVQVNLEIEMEEDDGMGELGYPVTSHSHSASPSRPQMTPNKDISEDETDDYRTRMIVDDIATTSPALPVESSLQSLTDSHSGSVAEEQERDYSTPNKASEDPLDIISVISRSPSPLNQPTASASPDRMSSSAPPERMSVDRNSNEADDENEADEDPVSVNDTSRTSPRKDSPNPSPNPKTPPPVERMDISPGALMLSPMVASSPKHVPPPVIIRISSSQQEQPLFSFGEDLPPTMPVRPTAPSPPARIKAATRYTLPPLSSLPAEMQKKGKPPKLRKRERDREKSASDSGKKEEFQPLGMARWAAILRSNPVYKKVSRATKCMTTRDWNIAMQELRLVRAFDRIELLKDAGRWSFRQPKKQRNLAVVPKAHWDYLLDEMKWLQVDFREERRFKIALAYQLSQDILDWHAADTREQRVKLGICAPWRRPSVGDIDIADVSMETADEPPPDLHATRGNADLDVNAEDKIEDLEYPSDGDEPIADNREQHDVVDSLQPDVVLADATTIAETPPTISPKLEEAEGNEALHNSHFPLEKDPVDMDVDGLSQDETQDVAKLEAENLGGALNDRSANPMLSSEIEGLATTTPPSRSETSTVARELRSTIACLPDDELFISLDALSLSSAIECQQEFDTGVAQLPDLSTIFPDLQPYGLADLNGPDLITIIPEAKKKGDKRLGGDDSTKRVDETLSTKLYPSSVFMYTKPTLVSALQPGKKWRKGTWINLDDSPIMSDVDGPAPQASEPSTSELFDGRDGRDGRKQHPVHLHPVFVPGIPRDPRKRPASVPWSAAEENMLRKWADRYPRNWRLIADCMNSSKLRSRADLRTPFECFERYTEMERSAVRNGQLSAASSLGAIALLDELQSIPPTPSTPASSSSMTTRGIKRMATSAASNQNSLTVSTGSNTVETRKRRHHFILSETMRKVSKKREIHQRQNMNVKKQTGPVHDTHRMFDGKPKYTPLELSRMKCEKDVEEQKLVMQRRQEEARRNQILRAQMQSQLQNDPSKLQTTALQHNVPPIRSNQVNISQQQQQKFPGQGGTPVSPQTMLQMQQAQARAQAQAQQTQMQSQVASGSGVNGNAQNSNVVSGSGGGAASPQSQHSSPPRSTGTPSNSTNFPRPPSAQRLSMVNQGGIGLGAGHVSVPGNPIARTNIASFLANGGQMSQEQVAQMLRYYPQQQNQMLMHQHAQLQMSQQLQQMQQQQNGFSSNP